MPHRPALQPDRGVPALLLAVAATTTFLARSTIGSTSRLPIVLNCSTWRTPTWIEHGQVIRTDIVNMAKDPTMRRRRWRATSASSAI
jgi:hypothetical protein